MADDIRALVEQALSEVLTVSGDGRVVRGSALESIMTIPAERLHALILDKIDNTLRVQTILNAEEMTEGELDGLAANVLVARDQGGKATGSVRVYFSRPQAFSITRGSVFQTDGGLRFFVVTPVSITESSMQLNVDGGRFYLDVPLVEAEQEGDSYDVEAGRITSFSAGGQAVVGVNNLVAFSGGRARETNAELVARMQDAVAVRDLVIRRSIRTLLFQNFPDIESIYSSGYGDPETMHDQKFGVHIGGEIYVHVESPRLDEFETVLTGFSTPFRTTGLDTSGNTIFAATGFVRSSPLIADPKYLTEQLTLVGSPGSVTVTAGSDTLEEIDTSQPFVVRQPVTDEAHSFPAFPTPAVGGQFTIDHPGRSVSNVVITSATDGTRYFCGEDYTVEPATGVVTRQSASMDDDVLVSYSWKAVLGVDYVLDSETGEITVVETGLLETGDVISVSYHYFAAGARDDTAFTITNTPVRRFKGVYLLDSDDNVIDELPFVEPVYADGGDNTFSLTLTAEAAPSSGPWWTMEVLGFNAATANDPDNAFYILDGSGLYENFERLLSFDGFLPLSPPAPPWPQRGSLRYTVHEELRLHFVNPTVPFDSTSRLRVDYEVPTTVRIVQNFLDDPENRVLCSRALARAFVPAYVDINFYGLVGDADTVVAAVEEYLRELPPGNTLRSADLVRVIVDEELGGATTVNTPFSMVANISFPRGESLSVNSTGELDIAKLLDEVDPGLSAQEFVTNQNVKFLPGTIQVVS